MLGEVSRFVAVGSHFVFLPNMERVLADSFWVFVYLGSRGVLALDDVRSFSSGGRSFHCRSCWKRSFVGESRWIFHAIAHWNAAALFVGDQTKFFGGVSHSSLGGLVDP